MKPKSVMVMAATAVALGGGAVAATNANAAGDKYHVAFIAPPEGRGSVNSIKVINAGAGGQDTCIDIYSLTYEGGAYTTDLTVYYNKEVDVSTWSARGCRDLIASWTEVPKWTDQKYFYINVAGPQ